MRKTPQNCLEVPATRAARLLVLTRPILVRSVINAVPIVDAVAHFYHICYITVRILKREPRFLTQVHGHVTAPNKFVIVTYSIKFGDVAKYSNPR